MQAANGAQLKGVVVDPAGAVVVGARVRLIDANGKMTVETFTGSNGTFELATPPQTVTLSVYAKGLGQFRKELHLVERATETVEVKLTVECSVDIKQLIPRKLDLHRFLVEIHHYGAFGDCPEETYRLWGTGEASVTYSGCEKTFRNSRFVEPTGLATILVELAKQHSSPVCSYYAGGIDAPTVELTIFSGSEPRLVISHDEGAEIQSVSQFERQLEKLIDPEGQMQSFRARANSKH